MRQKRGAPGSRRTLSPVRSPGDFRFVFVIFGGSWSPAGAEIAVLGRSYEVVSRLEGPLKGLSDPVSEEKVTVSNLFLFEPAISHLRGPIAALSARVKATA